MAIQLGDIKLVASVNLDDVPEGGGAPSAHVVQDNVSNAVFKDISEADRARGRLNMSKLFVSVQTQDVDTYLGSNVIVGRPPADENVSVNIFTSNQVYDTRSQAAARVEAYLNKGPEWAGFLYENHIAGQRTIQFFQRPGSELPVAGKTLTLVQNEGLGNEKEQYVRATRVSAVERTFTYDEDKDYKALIVSLELSDALRTDFKGTPANRAFRRNDDATKVRDTVVADAAVYAGVVPLAAPIHLGDLTLKAKTIYTALVPSAQVETPITATSPYVAIQTPVSAPAAVTYSASQGWNTTTNFFLPGGCTPGSLRIDVSGSSITDKGGLLMAGEQQVGTIDYANGVLTSLANDYSSSSKNVTYRPAAFMPRVPQSASIPITAEGRSQNYVGFITPAAAPGTLSVSYQAQGRWYVLTDDGSGALRGFDSSFGAGTYNPATGGYVATLGALPDVGSALVLQWGVPTQEYSHPVADIQMTQKITLAKDAADYVQPSTVAITWQGVSIRGSTDKRVIGKADGTFDGDGIGTINGSTGEIIFAPNFLPVYGTELTITYATGVALTRDFTGPSRDAHGNLQIDLRATSLVPGSVEVTWNTDTDLTVMGVYNTEQLTAMGIGVGGARVVDPIHTAVDNGNGRLMLEGKDIGSVDYATGIVNFNPDTTIGIPRINYSPAQISGDFVVRGHGGPVIQPDTRLWRLNYAGISYITAPTTFPIDLSGHVNVKYLTTAASAVKTQTVQIAPEFPLVKGLSAPVIPGSVVLMLGGVPLGDNGAGVLREQTDAGWVERAEVNYTTGVVKLKSWSGGQYGGPYVSSTVSRASTITTTGEGVSSAYVFRTAAAPIRPGSLSLQFARATGGTQIVTAGTDGVINSNGVLGKVDYQTGLVAVGFGSYVTAAGNEHEPWFNAALVDTTSGKVFKPAPVAVSSVKYSAVAYSYLPLNAELVGIDPVRLPSDGRVPIFRTGSMVVIGNTKVSAPMTVTNNQVVDLGRTRLSRVLIRNSVGAAVYSGYEVDLDAGKVTIKDVSVMSMPITIEDRIEDMAVARDVQISGDMAFTKAISHNYPVEGTFVSSALEFGDRKARVSVVFDQQTWDQATWQDTPTSATSVATYNTILAPIEVTNAGASTERFALLFTSSSSFRIIGEHIGQIGTGDINTDCAPVNPATNQPYFTVRASGWGLGWSIGNVLRFNTIGALCPVWVVRTVQPGIEAGIDYSFDLLTRGDVDRPEPTHTP